MRILHIAEPLSGGVPHAIESYARATKHDHEHHLLGVQGIEVDSRYFKSVSSLPDGVLARVLSTKRHVDSMAPDVVHAHSSFAGAYARLTQLGVPVVYQPHCYVFDDPGRPVIHRILYKVVEGLLGRRSAVTLALTPHEEALAYSLRPSSRGNVVQVPNVATCESLVRDLTQPEPVKPFTVTMIGRVSPQKSPDFFGQVARLVRARAEGVRFIWIGGGAGEAEAELRESGVEVSGWVEPWQVVRLLDDSDLYFHSASYEGFPLSVLQAAARDLPILVRNVAWTMGYEFEMARTADEVANRIIELSQDPSRLPHLQAASRKLQESMTVDAQRDALNAAYAAALANHK